MNKYLLLRDNKQTGPYTVEELVKKGLKPYDLVWLDGRSAAWRYPSEIDELKAFAPVVEEQPYDRFYKRSSSTQEHAIHATQQQHNTEQSTIAAEANNAKEINANIPVARSGTGKVYVTLPAGFRQQPPVQQPVTVVAKETTTVEPVQQTTGKPETTPQEEHGVSKEDTLALEARAAALAQSIQAAAKRQSAQEVIQADKLSAANAKATKTSLQSVEQTSHFSSLIDKQQPAETIPVIHNRNQQERKRLLFMRSMVAACLLLGGIVIGMALNYSKSDTANQEVLNQLVQRLQEKETQRQTGVQSTLPASDATNPPANQDYTEEDLPPSDEHNAVQPENSTPELAVKEKPVPPVVNGNDAPITYQEKDPSGMKVTSAVVTHKEEPRPVREADIAAAREKIYEMVQVAASPFQTGVLGGISNLYFTVSNTSSFPIDQIELEIKYLGPEKRVVKVQRLIFNDVAAGALKTLEAPRTTRGVSIDYVITKINSRALGIAYTGF